MSQKQKNAVGGENGPKTGQKSPKDNQELAKAASHGQDVLKELRDILKELEELEQAQKKKGGHYEMCCGVKIWVPDPE